jgi:hypothetical protein
MKPILTLTLSSIAAYFLMLLLPLILIAWLRGRDITRRTQFDAANCAQYQNTEYGTNYTAAEIDDAYRRAMEEKKGNSDIADWIDDAYKKAMRKMWSNEDDAWIDEVQKRITEK